MTATLLLVALLLAAGIQVSVQQTCHTNKLEGCIRGLGEYARDNETPLPRNKEELDKQCEIFKNVRNCTYNFSIKCISDLTRTFGNIIVLSTAEKMKQFCTDGEELNKKYLENAKCIDDNYGGVTPCIKSVLSVLETLPKRVWKDRLPSFCCGLGRFRSCLRDHYLTTCNQDAVELVETIVEFGVTDLGVEACEAIEKGVTCPELPPPGTELDGSYKNNLLGQIVGSFLRE